MGAARDSACGAQGEYGDSEPCVEYSRHSSTHRRRRLWLARSRAEFATRAGRWISGADGWCIYRPGRYGRVSASICPGVTILERGADVLRGARPGFLVALSARVSCTHEVRDWQLAGSERGCRSRVAGSPHHTKRPHSCAAHARTPSNTAWRPRREQSARRSAGTRRPDTGAAAGWHAGCSVRGGRVACGRSGGRPSRGAVGV